MPQPDPPDDGTRVRPKGPESPASAETGANTGSWTAGGAGRSSRAEVPPRLGRFEVRGVLGEGAFGCVYLAFDPELQRQVAIKVPRPDGLTTAFRERFLREARATATIHHPNVCPVYEVGTEGEVPFIVMHYVVGGTLAALLSRLAKPLSARQALVIARKLALGVAAAHAKSVIHRDLKPQNILYDRTAREVLITDFGLARLATASRETADGTVLGTPAYMSPEQARGRVEEVGPPSDVYSLGVILYHLLTGELPFTGSVFEVMAQHCEAPPRPPSAVNAALDPRLDELCLKAMAKKPADRYPSAKEFADALADYLRDKPEGAREGSLAEIIDAVVVPPPAPPQEPAEKPATRVLVVAQSSRGKSRRPRRRSRRPVLFVILGVLTLAVIVTVAVVLNRSRPPEAAHQPDPGAQPGGKESEAPAPRPEDKLKAELIGRWKFVGLPHWLGPAEAKKIGFVASYLEFKANGTAEFDVENRNGATKSVPFDYKVLTATTILIQVAPKANFKADKKETLVGVRTVLIEGNEMTLVGDNGKSSKLVKVKGH